MPSIFHAISTAHKNKYSPGGAISVKISDTYKKVDLGYTLVTDALSEIESWTEEQEEEERLVIFNQFLWFPVAQYSCEYCDKMVDLPEINLQYGFAFQPDDYDRLRILCDECLED